MKKVRDHYARRAQQEGFAARSAYKLEEMARRHRLLRPGMRVLDLGCAPGSWLQVAAAAVGPGGWVVGVDPQPVELRLPGTVRLIQGDVLALEPAVLLALLPAGASTQDGRYDLLLSDMAPKTTGIPSADAERSAELAQRALELAQTVLKPGGAAVVKVFQGARFPELRKRFAAAFETVRVEKPTASRSESVEVFLVGLRLGPQAGPSAQS